MNKLIPLILLVLSSMAIAQSPYSGEIPVSAAISCPAPGARIGLFLSEPVCTNGDLAGAQEQSFQDCQAHYANSLSLHPECNITTCALEFNGRTNDCSDEYDDYGPLNDQSYAYYAAQCPEGYGPFSQDPSVCVPYIEGDAECPAGYYPNTLFGPSSECAPIVDDIDCWASDWFSATSNDGQFTYCGEVPPDDDGDGDTNDEVQDACAGLSDFTCSNPTEDEFSCAELGGAWGQFNGQNICAFENGPQYPDDDPDDDDGQDDNPNDGEGDGEGQGQGDGSGDGSGDGQGGGSGEDGEGTCDPTAEDYLDCLFQDYEWSDAELEEDIESEQLEMEAEFDEAVATIREEASGLLDLNLATNGSCPENHIDIRGVDVDFSLCRFGNELSLVGLAVLAIAGVVAARIVLSGD